MWDPFYTTFSTIAIWSETHPNMSFWCNWVDWMFVAKNSKVVSVLMRTSPAQIWPCQPLLYQRCNHSIWGLSLMHLMNWCSTIKCVYFYFQNYLHGSREGLIAYGKHGRLMKLIGDQIQVFPTSSTWTPRHFWSKERKRSNPTRFGPGFGLQDSSNLWCSPRSHTDSDLGVQVLHGKLIKSTFQRI